MLLKKLKRHSTSPPVENRTINTVLEPKATKELGTILAYEHLMIDGTKLYQEASLLKKYESHFKGRLKRANLEYISYEPYSCAKNLILDDEIKPYILNDMEIFLESVEKKSNGATIVEHTVDSMRPENYFETLRWLSENSKINIIVGTGYACRNLERAETYSLTEEDMYNNMKHQIENGSSGVKAAFIGEIGCSWPIDDCEKRALTAAGLLQEQLQLPVSLNPGTNVNAPDEMLRIYTEAGGQEKHAAMCHLDRLMQEEQIIDFFDGSKCFCLFSNFGTEISYCQVNPEIDVLSDAQRVKYIQYFKQNRQIYRLLLSHGIHTRHRLLKYGGHGFSHINNTVKPFMLYKNYKDTDLTTMTVSNPLRWITTS